MADNYLENHYLDYLRRKEEWLKKKKKSDPISSPSPKPLFRGAFFYILENNCKKMKKNNIFF